MVRPYEEGSNGKCPHCQHIVYFDEPVTVYYHRPTGGQSPHPKYLVTVNGDEQIHVYSSQCPNCKKPIITIEIRKGKESDYRLVHPFNVVRTVSHEVPKEIQEDFLEAASVIPISEKASAALSRRCLENVLTDRGYKGKDLNEQIEKALKYLPPRIGENLDAIRNIGNFAAHPMKYQTTGLVVDVEPEEAEWNLDVLEELFDYYYVQPKRAEEKRKKLEEKLKGLGKPPLKKS